jgi:tRNA (adenine37-N6)-methyltransferase
VLAYWSVDKEYNDMTIVLTPIGLIHTPFSVPSETPIQASRSKTEGWVEVFPQFTEGLQDIEAFSHLFLLYQFHQTEQVHLLVEPFLDDRKHGIFATRHPFRPNHIGISIVQLLSRQGSSLFVLGVDIIDQTPLLDIKPYVTDFDQRELVHSGWYENRSRA